MDFREVDGQEYMLPTISERHILSLVTDLSNVASNQIPVENLEFVSECFEEISHNATFNINAGRHRKLLGQASELILDYARDIIVCDKALADISAFLLEIADPKVLPPDEYETPVPNPA